MGISFNPMPTTGITGGFVKATDGYSQGVVLDDPGLRYQIEGVQVSSVQTPALWGGLPVQLTVPAIGVNAQGSFASISGSLAEINAWVCYNQASGGIITPSSNAPVYSAGMSANVVRVGSGLRIALPVKKADLNNLAAHSTLTNIYWDPTNLYITTTSSSNYGPLAYPIEALSITSKTVSYDAGTGNTTWSQSDATVAIAVVRI